MKIVGKTKAFSLVFLSFIFWTTKVNAYDYAYNGLYFNIDLITSTASLTSNGSGSYSGNITIPEKFVGPKEIEYVVTSIGENAFYNCRSLNSVSIPNTVTAIGKNAFYGCNSISKIALPNMITEIGEGAFRGCTKLTTLDLPPLLTVINPYLLYGCNNITSVTIPSKVTEIKNNAFENCSKLPRVTLPQALLTIGQSAFSNCTSLSDVTLSAVLKTIGESVFYNCTSLSVISLPGTLETIGSSAFYNTTSLLNITIPASLITIGSEAFSSSALQTLAYADGCTVALRTWATKMVSVLLPQSIEEIANDAFRDCTLLTNVSLPGMLNSIGSSAFYNCKSMTKLFLPASVRTIGSDAFYYSGITNLEYASGTQTALRTYATGLTTVFIPSTVKSFAPDLFSGCNQLENIHISDLEMWNLIFSRLSADPFPVAHKIFLNGNLLTALNADFGCDISNYAFCNCIGLKQVNITGSITGIQDFAFMQCPDLEAVAMGSGVKRIGMNAFQGCTALTAVRLGSKVNEIGKNAFYGCSTLNSLLMGGSEQIIGEAAFQGCSKLPVAKLPNSLTTIGSSAFRECYELQEVIIPAGITIIPDYAFYHCPKLFSLQIGEAVNSIQSYAFYGCESLNILRIPNATTTIADNAFNNCKNLRYAFLGTGINNIGNKAFGNCKRLVSFYCEALNVESCHSYAFDGSEKEYIILYVPDESVESYNSKSPWNGFGAIAGLASAPHFVNSIALSSPVLVLEEGDAAKIEATVSPDNATNKNVNWTSSNTDIVYVNNKGSVLANVEGIATVRVTAADGNGASTECLIIVSNNFKAVSEVSLSNNQITLSEGKEAYLTATTSPTLATYSEVVWTSSNPLVAQVSNVGLVTALATGTATITCSAADGKGAKANCKVTVTEPVDPTIGDADEDGHVTVADLVYVISVIRKRIEAGDDISLYDINNDGIITSEDANAIADIILLRNRETTVHLLELAAENITVGIGDILRLNRTVIPHKWNSQLIWSSSDENIVKVDNDGVITALHAGSAYVTVKVKDGSDVQAQCLITVDGSRGSTDGHAWVDLGLPSGTRWATANIGASTPQNYGNYYAWGEMNTKNNYNWGNYTHCDDLATAMNKYCTAASHGKRDDKIQLETIDDVAFSSWSDNWTLPTTEQFDELFNSAHTTSTWTEQNGIYGRLVTSKKNGNTLFLPAAGYMNGDVLNSLGSGGYYATKNLSDTDCQYNRSFNFGSSQGSLSDTYRCYGQSVRPVGSSTLVINPSSAVMEVGETLNLQAEFKTINGIESTTVTWTSSNTDIATVDNNGVVKALSNGVVYIYATTENGIVGYCRIMVGVIVYEDWTSTNAGKSSSSSSHTWVVEGYSGMLISFDWKVSSESGYDKLTIKKNNETIVNGVSGEKSGSYNYLLTSDATITFTATYTKDSGGNNGDDKAQISNFRVVDTGKINSNNISPLSYIHFDGGYLETDVYMKSSISFQMKIRPKAAGGGAFIGNTRISDSQDFRFFMSGNTTYIDAMSARRSNSILSLNNDYELEFGNFYLKNLNTGSTLLSGTAQTFDYTGNNDAHIYVCSSSSDKAYIYYLKVFDNGVLIRDYIPCRLEATEVLGFYDQLNNTFTPVTGNVIAGTGPSKTVAN